ncbi:DODA-type extradiol aromatic ring-opening family dioxygenase [Saccharospirillum mangrovi]|uniref:DODA-type extradiol aromatic ring-opening family dioxygenase n=1 Tax=Saccharospirillum mangrovi TaxID=2161747 RepID=UPI000D38CA0E|nr:class III extradiol ring-cleavage dioxygenase [Saccharospirillum mangrovi]
MSTKAPVFFLPHGGGPMPLMGDPGHRPIIDLMTQASSLWTQPKAILVISAHWEAELPTVLADTDPGLYFDYYGFPRETYEYRYPAQNPEPWQQAVKQALSDAGLDFATGAQRGYDHGVFVPLKLMYPQADLPVMQLSLVHNLDPQTHLELGRALAPLRDQGVMILGSGFSFHNMRAYKFNGGAAGPESEAFHGWLVEQLTDSALTAEQREAQLAHWAEAPYARFCHPREEHLLPLHVCLGAAEGAAAEIVFDQALLGQRAIGALWR